MNTMISRFNFLHHPRTIIAARIGLLAYIALIIYLSLMPVGQQMPVQIWDKAAHLLAYIGFTGIATLCTRSQRHFVLYLLGFTLFGVAIEIAQGMTPHRQFSYADMFANTLGVVAGYMIALLVNKLLPLPCFTKHE